MLYWITVWLFNFLSNTLGWVPFDATGHVFWLLMVTIAVVIIVIIESKIQMIAQDRISGLPFIVIGLWLNTVPKLYPSIAGVVIILVIALVNVWFIRTGRKRKKKSSLFKRTKKSLKQGEQAKDDNKPEPEKKSEPKPKVEPEPEEEPKPEYIVTIEKALEKAGADVSLEEILGDYDEKKVQEFINSVDQKEIIGQIKMYYFIYGISLGIELDEVIADAEKLEDLVKRFPKRKQAEALKICQKDLASLAAE